MRWTWLLIGCVAAYFVGHVLSGYYGISVWQMASGLFVWLVLGLIVGLIFGACVQVGRGE